MRSIFKNLNEQVLNLFRDIFLKEKKGKIWHEYTISIKYINNDELYN